MGLTDRLTAFAAARPHALVVPLPGSTGLRLAVERELRRRGWPAAASPADADLLVVCGTPADDARALVERTWRQLPGPRARLDLLPGDDVPRRLDGVPGRLGDRDAAQRDAAARAGDRAAAEASPAMADRDDDRDGLRLDVLHPTLGPVLPAWPAGLVLRTALQGDVLQTVEVEVVQVDGLATRFWSDAPHPPGVRAAAHRLDGLGRLLAVAGWGGAARASRDLRDDLLAGVRPADVRPRLDRLARRVGRSRTLAWLGRDLGVVDHGPGAPLAAAAGDVVARYRRWLEEARAALDAGPDRLPPSRAAATDLLDALPRLLTGLDVGTARLVVASLDPDLDEVAAPREVVRG